MSKLTLNETAIRSNIFSTLKFTSGQVTTKRVAKSPYQFHVDVLINYFTFCPTKLFYYLLTVYPDRFLLEPSFTHRFKAYHICIECLPLLHIIWDLFELISNFTLRNALSMVFLGPLFKPTFISIRIYTLKVWFCSWYN